MRKCGKTLWGILLATAMVVTGTGFSGIISDSTKVAKAAEAGGITADGKLSDSNIGEEHKSANGITTKDNGLMRTNLSSIEFMTKEGMGLGWNLGNQLEESNVSGYNKTVEECETNAGAPVATQKTFDGLKKTGVNTVRVPVAWSNFLTMEIPQKDGEVVKVTGASNMYKAVDAIKEPIEGVTPATEDTYYRVSDELMDRIETVINYALNDEMYVIFNIHWDGGWWGMFGAEEWDGTPLAETDMSVNPVRYQAYKKYCDIWTQLSERFKEYSDRVIFEGANEELSGRLNDDYKDPGKAQTGQTGKLGSLIEGKEEGDPHSINADQIYAMVNQINQTFVDIVRASGGNNAYRQLLIPGTGHESCVIGGYPGDIYANDGSIDDRFEMPKDPAEEETGKTKMSISVHYYDPTIYGISATASTPWGYTDTWGTEQDKKEMAESLDRMKKFTDKDYGVIIGECGCVKGYKDGVTDYAETIFDYALKNGMCPVWWDEGHYYDRENGYWSYVDLGQVYMDFYGITLDPVKDADFINPKPFYTGIKSVPTTKNQSPKVVATWEGEFMRHTNAETGAQLLIDRPDDVTQFINDNGGVEIGVRKTTKEENLTALIEPVNWNISVKTDWSKIKEPCVRVYPMNNEISKNADLQLGYIGQYTEDKYSKKGELIAKAGDQKGTVKYDVDYDPLTGLAWDGKYIQLDREALVDNDMPWLWVTTNTYTGASYVKIELCDAAYNADGTEFGKEPVKPSEPTKKPEVKNACKSVKTAKKTVKVKKKKTATLTFNVTNETKSQKTTDTLTVKSSKTKIVKITKKTMTANKLKVKVKGLKKGKSVVTVKIGSKTAKTTVKVK